MNSSSEQKEAVVTPLAYVADANFLLRLAEKAHHHRPVAMVALTKIGAAGDKIHIPVQSLYEFYAVATRPATQRNGLGCRSQTL